MRPTPTPVGFLSLLFFTDNFPNKFLCPNLLSQFELSRVLPPWIHLACAFFQGFFLFLDSGERTSPSTFKESFLP